MSLRIKKILIVMIGMLFLPTAWAIPPKKTWEIWTQNNPQSQQKIDHSEWQAFLDKYIYKGKNHLNVVAYGIVTRKDRRKLDHYLRSMEKIPIRNYNRDEQLAYWINLYNATIVELVLQYYPINSILDIDISNKLLEQGPWSSKVLRVENIPISLRDISAHILRPIWNDPRLIYVLNLPAAGAPNIPTRAITANNAWPLMDQAAHEYINTRGVKIQNHRLFVSKIYQWFKEDFGGSDKAIIAHLNVYADPELERSITRAGSIANTYFDWKLNG